MTEGYTIWAYSPSLNIEQRQFILTNMTPVPTAELAQKYADTFAHEFNRIRKMHATDWQPRIKWEQLGQLPQKF